MFCVLHLKVNLQFLLNCRAAQSCNQAPDDWEGNLMRFGSWLWNPIANLPSLLQTQSRSVLEQKINILNESHLSGLAKHRIYQVSRNCTSADAMINYELLARLILQIDATMTPGKFDNDL